jgi:hypothetical protein
MTLTWGHLLALIPIGIILLTILSPGQPVSDTGEEAQEEEEIVSVPKSKSRKTPIHTLPTSIKEYRLPDGSKVAVDTSEVEVDERSAI